MYSWATRCPPPASPWSCARRPLDPHGPALALDHINLWLLRDKVEGREGWTVVDCCISRDESKAQWEQVFATELGGLPILRVLVTHMHPDHIGLAHWLCERWSTPEHACRLWISSTDYNAARVASHSTTGFGGENAARYFASQGLVDPESLAEDPRRSSYYPGLVPAVPASYRRLKDDDVLTIGGHAWRCIAGYGHAPEHMALYCEALQVLISGDMVPAAHLHQRERLRHRARGGSADAVPGVHRPPRSLPDTLVLPSHGKPFRGLHARIRQLHEHHRDRLAEVIEACSARPCSAADVMPVLFKRKLDLHQTTFAMGESVAHLHALWHAGKLRRARDAEGVWRFAAS